jgi:hypothetical protein
MTEALQGDIVDRVIRFGVDGEAVTIEGRQIVNRRAKMTLNLGGQNCTPNYRQIELIIPDTWKVVEIFFTAQHADYWLSQARPVADATGAAEAPSDPLKR